MSNLVMRAIKERYLEELESIRAYDAVKVSGDEAVPFTQAVAEIERDRS